MYSLQVRGLPEDIYRELVRLAEKERRSLAQQAIAVLERGLAAETDPRERRKAVLEEIKRANLSAGKHLPDIAKMIREDRDR